MYLRYQTLLKIGVNISEQRLFTIGDSAVITCTSVISVEEILWLDYNGTVLVNESSSNSSVKSASLTFNQVNDSIHNKDFTCRAVLVGTVEEDITLNVLLPGKFLPIAIGFTIINFNIFSLPRLHHQCYNRS